MKVFIERIKAKTPKFWKDVQKYALIVGGSAAAVMVANTQFNLILHDWFLTAVSYVVVVCAAIAGTAQLTKE